MVMKLSLTTAVIISPVCLPALPVYTDSTGKVLMDIQSLESVDSGRK